MLGAKALGSLDSLELSLRLLNELLSMRFRNR